MARTLVAAVKQTNNGVAPPAEVAGDTVNGNYVVNSGKTQVTVRNAHATTPFNVTFVTSTTVAGHAVADLVVSVPAASSLDFGDFAPSVFGSAMGIDVASTELKITAREP